MTADTEMQTVIETVRYLKDRRDIEDCILREVRARDRQDTKQMNSCWWEDGVDEHGAIIAYAPEYAERSNTGHRMFFTQTSHNITNHLCEIDGDTAHAESYVIGALAWKEGDKTTIAMGRYLDRLEKRGGEWRILVRRCTIEATLEGDGSWVNSTNVKGFLKGIWSRDDPSYERPFNMKTSDEGVRW